MREEYRKFVSLIGHRIEFLESVQPIKPLQIPGANPTGTVVDDYRLLWALGHNLF